MAHDPILHIKDAYFFEVPKVLWSPKYERLEDIPSHLAFLRCDETFERDNPALNDARKAEHLITQKREADRTDPAAFKNSPAGKEYTRLLGRYNDALAGKVLIPQLPGVRLKNFYETSKESPIPGFSKFMLIELVVAAILFVVFTQYARRIQNGGLPKGRFWNLIDTFLTFLRDQVVRPSIGEHDADRFLPFIYTLFFFILGCNLAGMLPWSGSPTGEFGVTLALAAITLATTLISGIVVFGPVGFFLNQAPVLGVRESGYLAPLLFVIKVLLLIIEFVGLLIKHAVLGVRLLANMVAGHLVLGTILGIAAAAAGSAMWFPTAAAVVLGCTLLSVMELFVAFLQAYIFCFLASLFIGAAVHTH